MLLNNASVSNELVVAAFRKYRELKTFSYLWKATAAVKR